MTTCKVCGGELRPPKRYERQYRAGKASGHLELTEGPGLVHDNRMAWMVYPHKGVPEDE